MVISEEKIKIEATLLGTGTSQGVPVIACDCNVCQSADEKNKRLRSSLLLKVNDIHIVIDAGPDFRTQMLREKVESLRAILLTHEHADHVFGLDDIRSFNWKQKHPTDIYAEERVQETVRRIFSYVFTNFKYPGVPKMKLHNISGRSFNIEGIKIVPIRCYHHKLPVYGFRIGDLTYITDANQIPPQEMEKIKGSKVLIINCLRKKKHISHFNLEEALGVINEINPQQSYLTHLSHEFGLHRDIQDELPDHVFVGYDGLKLKL
jgi:phosphoribosyl 1,2-cyclic phosphate phosphodiesterase